MTVHYRCAGVRQCRWKRFQLSCPFRRLSSSIFEHYQGLRRFRAGHNVALQHPQLGSSLYGLHCRICSKWIFSIASSLHPISSTDIGFGLYALLLIGYRIFLHPLHRCSGPLFAKLTDWYAGIFVIQKRLPQKIWRNHEKYGPVVRIAPDSLVFNTVTALQGESFEHPSQNPLWGMAADCTRYLSQRPDYQDVHVLVYIEEQCCKCFYCLRQ